MMHADMTTVKTLSSVRPNGDNCHAASRSGLDNCYDMRNSLSVYRPPSRPPKTAWARHLDSVRRREDWSAQEMFEKAAADLGYSPKSRTAFLPYLEDREPTAAAAAVLRRHFGDPPPDAAQPEPEPTPQDVLIAAMLAQTNAITALVEEMRLHRERDQDAARAMLDAAKALVSAQRPPATPESKEPAAPLGSA